MHNRVKIEQAAFLRWLLVSYLQVYCPCYGLFRRQLYIFQRCKNRRGVKMEANTPVLFIDGGINGEKFVLQNFLQVRDFDIF